MVKIVRVWIVSAFAVLFLVACGGGPPSTPIMPDITFKHKAPLMAAASSVTVTDVYQSTLRKPYVEHEYRLRPNAIAKSWASNRLNLSGAGGKIELRVLDASVVEKELPTKSGIMDFFYIEESTELTASLKVDLLFTDARGTATVSTQAKAKTTLLENMTLNEIELAYFNMLETLAKEFDQRLEDELLRALPNAIRR